MVFAIQLGQQPISIVVAGVVHRVNPSGLGLHVEGPLRIRCAGRPDIHGAAKLFRRIDGEGRSAYRNRPFNPATKPKSRANSVAVSAYVL
jgi:hypothetical protein